MPTNLRSHERGCIHSHGALYYHHDRTILLPGCRTAYFKLGQSPLYYAPVCGMILMILVRPFPYLLHIQHIKKQGWSAAITLTSLVFQGHGFFHHWSTTPQLRLSIIPLTSGGIPPACSPGILGRPQLRLNNKHGPRLMAVNGILSSGSNRTWVSPYISPQQSWEICLKRMIFLVHLLELPI